MTCLPLLIAALLNSVQHDRLGHSVTVLKDLDKDGFEDIAIGNPAATSSEVWIVSGKTAKPIRRIAWENHRIGWIVRNAGDIDGDGSEELLILASPDYPALEGGDVGVFSAYGELLFEVQVPRIEHLRGASDGLTMPHIDMGSVGDLNGDGVPDFHADTNVYSGKNGDLLFRMGATLPPEERQVVYVGETERGAEFLVLTLGVAYVMAPPNRIRHVFRVSDKPYIMRGAGGGDLDGDGHTDYLFGHQAEGESAKSGLGRVSAFSGKTGERLYVQRVRDSVWSVFFGDSLTFVGDLNDDGCDDFVTNGYWDFVRACLGKDGSKLWTYPGVAKTDSLFSFSPISDLDDDGVSDLVVGECRTVEAGGGSTSADVSIISGKTGKKIHAITRRTLEESESGS